MNETLSSRASGSLAGPTILFPLLAALGLGVPGCGDPTAALRPPSTIGAQECPPVELPAVEDETVAAIANDRDVYSRARRLGALLPTLGPDDVDQIVAALEDPSLSLGAGDRELLLQFWATQQPEAASEFAATRSPTGHQFADVLTTLTVWAERDPEAAKTAANAWVSRARSRLLADAVQVAMIRGWYAKDPVSLTSFVREIGMSIGQQNALAKLVKEIIRAQGVDGAILWAEGLEDEGDGFKQGAFAQVASALPLFDMDAARRFCEVHCDGPYGLDLRSLISRRWAVQDGSAAMEWLLDAPDSHEKNLGLRITFAQFAQADPEGAKAWMAERTRNGPQPWMTPIYPVYARLLLQKTPADAIEWAERVEGDNEREAILIVAARKWRLEDREAADAWLAASSLSDEARAKVLEIDSPDEGQSDATGDAAGDDAPAEAAADAPTG